LKPSGPRRSREKSEDSEGLFGLKSAKRKKNGGGGGKINAALRNERNFPKIGEHTSNKEVELQSFTIYRKEGGMALLQLSEEKGEERLCLGQQKKMRFLMEWPSENWGSSKRERKKGEKTTWRRRLDEIRFSETGL